MHLLHFQAQSHTLQRKNAALYGRAVIKQYGFSSESSLMDVTKQEKRRRRGFFLNGRLSRGETFPDMEGSHHPARRHRPAEKNKSFFMYLRGGLLHLWFVVLVIYASRQPPWQFNSSYFSDFFECCSALTICS